MRRVSCLLLQYTRNSAALSHTETFLLLFPSAAQIPSTMSCANGRSPSPEQHLSAKRPRPAENAPDARGDSLPLGCVILIEVTSTSPDFLFPWKMKSQQRSSGSGFVIDGDKILTNYHVVEDAIDVRLRKHGVSRRWRGKVVAIGPDVDLALLEVHEEEAGKGESFWSAVKPVVWHDALPNLQDAVNVCGFPTGGTTISVTAGVVSRIDCKNYRIGKTYEFNPGGLLVLQIDAAINSGNSGGPACAKDGSVVGVAFQSLGGDADGIGYLIPAVVCRNFLLATQNGQPYKGVADVPCITRELENPSLRRRHHVADDASACASNAPATARPRTALWVRVCGLAVGVECRLTALASGCLAISCALRRATLVARADDGCARDEGVCA